MTCNMHKREIAKRMKQDEAVTRGDTWINRQVKKKMVRAADRDQNYKHKAHIEAREAQDKARRG